MDKETYLVLDGTIPRVTSKAEYEKFQGRIEEFNRIITLRNEDMLFLSFLGDFSCREYQGKPFFITFCEGGSLVEWNSVTREEFATYEEAIFRYEELAKTDAIKA
jgi:hypothetical protein